MPANLDKAISANLQTDMQIWLSENKLRERHDRIFLVRHRKRSVLGAQQVQNIRGSVVVEQLHFNIGSDAEGERPQDRGSHTLKRLDADRIRINEAAARRECQREQSGREFACGQKVFERGFPIKIETPQREFVLPVAGGSSWAAIGDDEPTIC